MMPGIVGLCLLCLLRIVAIVCCCVGGVDELVGASCFLLRLLDCLLCCFVLNLVCVMGFLVWFVCEELL